MTTLITEVPVVPSVAEDPEAHDREKQRLEGEFHRVFMSILKELQQAGLGGLSPSGRFDVVIQEKDAGRLLVIEAKTFPERIDPKDSRDQAAADMSTSAAVSPDEAERHYQALGRFKGPLAAEDVQRTAREYWKKAGTAGACWLVARLRSETHVERLHWAASALDDLGDLALRPILETLQGDAPPDQALALLRALGWMSKRQKTADPLAELVLVKHLLHDDPDVREAACTALRVLPPQQARTWLMRRLREDTDGEVRQTIEEELELIRAGQG
jgi:hypothetical protein